MENIENETIGDIREKERNNESKTFGHKNNKSFFVAVIFLSIFLSSTFGAIFGFMASTAGQKIFGNSLGKFSGALTAKSSPDKELIKQQVVEEDSAVIDVVDKATPAVVSIVISKDIPKVKNGSLFNPFDIPDFFGDSFGGSGNSDNGSGQNGSGTQKETIGGGTGFFITEDGMIVTNKHVVSDSIAEYTVITTDNQEHPAKVLALDPVNDIAVIKIDGSGYPILDLGDSSSLKIGQTVIAIGNSLGEFSNTVSRGIISGLKRNLTAGGGMGSQAETLNDIVQTDAAINPGNSGGPLLDINGNVIGINVAIAQGAQSIGFAIPSNQIKKVTDQVKTTGKISTPFLGVRYIPINKTIQQENNLPFDYGDLVARGSKITDFAVIPGSPADKAGISENDIVLEVNGTKIDDSNTLTNLISQYNIGTEIMLKVWHKGDTKDVKVKLEERK